MAELKISLDGCMNWEEYNKQLLGACINKPQFFGIILVQELGVRIKK